MTAPDESSPFHPGELAIQERVGVAERVAPLGRQFLRNHMPDQHREFFAQLPFLVLGTQDESGQPWASIVCAPSGFARSPDPQRLEIRARPLTGDPLDVTLRDGAPVGLLGIELHTRRRNRLNGVVRECTDEGFAIDVVQSFGNCPKYIQARRASFDPALAAARRRPVVEALATLDESALALIAAADTLYLASAFFEADGAVRGTRGIDVSHRGGKPGFVRVVDERTLLLPDFFGNNLFNTLGNLLLAPRAGLLFVDFVNGDLLYVAVTAEILWEGPEVEAYRGALRAVRFTVERARRVREVLPLTWGEAERSPFLEQTGDWAG
ncbi:MAG: pyridoxamine 5'-phosphate oxidase family protein [Gammaproteobacteria bacterium]|nr:pyridoxamine 5'-phosphate oxidase family protein [Gammaproteobacteria bacterium]